MLFTINCIEYCCHSTCSYPELHDDHECVIPLNGFVQLKLVTPLSSSEQVSIIQQVP